MKDKHEYQQYADYALERYLIEKEGYSEYDARVKVMQDYEEVKKWFAETEQILLSSRVEEWETERNQCEVFAGVVWKTAR